MVTDGRVLRSAAGSPPQKNGRALGDSRACLACKCTRAPLFYLEKKKERKKKSAVFSSRHKVFLWLRAAGCRPVWAGQRRGSLGEKGRIWLIIYQCQPHNDSPCSPPIDEDNYISSEWLINKAQGKWFIIAPPKSLFSERGLAFFLFFSFPSLNNKRQGWSSTLGG